MSVRIIIPKPNQFRDIAAFVANCDGIESIEAYFYRIVLSYFGDTSLIAKGEDGSICGWTFGFASQVDPKLFFLWQICVDKERREEGIGIALISELVRRAQKRRCKKMRVTVERENMASRGLFEKAGFKNISSAFKGALTQSNEPYLFDYYGEGDLMIMYERDLL